MSNIGFERLEFSSWPRPRMLAVVNALKDNIW
jgi:hypothetical protein